MRALVIIPTYNEKENISLIIGEIRRYLPEVHILVVDDSSPDGTGEIVQSLKNQDQRLHLLSRRGKEGLGKAYLAGFEWGIQNGYEVLVEMDADFSHRPVDLVQILKVIPDYDFVVGSRYVPQGGTINWGIWRKIISRGGSLYSRLILGFPLNDWTGGFNAWKVETLKKINLSSVESNGYSFQIELKYKAMKAGCQGFESPIVFEDRRVGNSKMSSRIVFEALVRVWMLKFQ